MRIFGLLSLLFFASVASAAGMSPVKANSGFCASKAGICYEWRLTTEPGVSFIAYGSEQGIDYSFFNVASGHYEQMVRVFPILRDSRYPGTLFLAYPQDIRDIALGPQGQLMASFKHTLTDDGEVYSPMWQKRVPAVLFVGATTQPQMHSDPINFRASSVRVLHHAAGG